MRWRKSLGGALLLAGTAWPVASFACGGCFTAPAPTIDQTVVQDAERVLFVRDAKTGESVVWVEVKYTGLAKDFGWVLPLPKVPKVGVGTALLFDGLDNRMAARMRHVLGNPENCRDPEEGCAKILYPPEATQGFADAAAGGGNGQVDADDVQVLDAGQTGPYDYLVVQGSSADPLLKWLKGRGYAVPDKATAIVQSHIAKGDVFVAIKLQNGQGIEQIRPIALRMPDAEACVPLRLTSIAAQDDMSVVVSVAGPGRAVVKNHLDVELNPLRLVQSGPALPCPEGSGACFQPSNFAQLSATAIDEAGGRAFVTEAARPGANVGELPLQDWDAKALEGVTNFEQLAKYLALSGLPVHAEVAAAWQADLALPLKKLVVDTSNPTAGPTPLQALAVLRACGQLWTQNGGFGGPFCNAGQYTLDRQVAGQTAVDGQKLAAAIQKEVAGPIQEVAPLLKSAPMVTRLTMRISPDEMDRDPIFAYNPALPQVNPVTTWQRNTVCMSGWSNGPQAQRLTLDGLGTWVVSDLAIIDPLFKKLPAALRIRLQDETGLPLEIDPGQVELVDTAIQGAVPGKPSLPEGLTLQTPKGWQPPASHPLVTTLGAWKKPPYCEPKTGWKDGYLPPTSTSHSGNVPGVDAMGGWSDTAPGADVGNPQPVTDGSPATDGGCTAGKTTPNPATWLAFLALGLVVARRRRALTFVK